MKKTFEAEIVGRYKLKFSRNMWGNVSIASWARNQGGGEWQWFDGKFPFVEKYENTAEWKAAWDKAVASL